MLIQHRPDHVTAQQEPTHGVAPGARCAAALTVRQNVHRDRDRRAAIRSAALFEGGCKARRARSWGDAVSEGDSPHPHGSPDLAGPGRREREVPVSSFRAFREHAVDLQNSPGHRTLRRKREMTAGRKVFVA